MVLIIHLSLCVVLIGLVLLQQGKGADLGAAFGSGSGSLFGASGAGSALVKATTSFAILFMVTSVLLVRLYPEAAQGGVVSRGSGDGSGTPNNDHLKGSLLDNGEVPAKVQDSQPLANVAVTNAPGANVPAANVEVTPLVVPVDEAARVVAPLPIASPAAGTDTPIAASTPVS